MIVFILVFEVVDGYCFVVCLLIVGLQGFGKGIQGVCIVEFYGIFVVLIGDIFCVNIKEGMLFGQQVMVIFDKGDFVFDELISEIVCDCLLQDDVVQGFLFDGYLCNMVQVEYFEVFFGEWGEVFDVVILFDVFCEESLECLMCWVIEQGCFDDILEVIGYCFDIYECEIVLIFEVYGVKGIVDCIDGVGLFDEIMVCIDVVFVVWGLCCFVFVV